MFYRFARDLLHILFLFIFSIRSEGLENLPQNVGYIVASNHRSNLDPIFVGTRIRPNLTFMAKVELFNAPVLGWIMRWVGAFPVERGKGDTGAVDFAVQTVQAGKVLAMFPEGHRSPDGKLLKPKSGCTVIAGATGAPVVPVAVCFGDKLRFRSRIVVRFGKPIYKEELGVDPGKPSTIRAGSRLIMERIAALLEAGEGAR